MLILGVGYAELDLQLGRPLLMFVNISCLPPGAQSSIVALSTRVQDNVRARSLTSHVTADVLIAAARPNSSSLTPGFSKISMLSMVSCFYHGGHKS